MQDDYKEQPLGKVEEEIHDVEEGEISDSNSVEEITEEVFNTKQQATASSPPPLKNITNSNISNVINTNSGGSGARVWTMRDIYKYQIASNTTYKGLHNLAWAQAVNNKPLDEVFVMVEGGSNNISNGMNYASGLMNASNGNEERIVIDVEEDEGEKEEGELEEGEIGLDSELILGNRDSIKEEVEGQANASDQLETSKLLFSIKEELEHLSVADVQKAYEHFCSSLETTADSLHKMVLEVSLVEKETLVQLLLTIIQRLYMVLSSMTLSLKEQNKVMLLRLLAHLTSLKPPLFSSPQLKEVGAVMFSLESSTSASSNDYNNWKQEARALNTTDLNLLIGNTNNDVAHLRNSGVESSSSGLLDQSEDSILLQNSKLGTLTSRPKGSPTLPLLDLHKDHDADSLPSPTRDLSAPFPFDRGLIQERGFLKPEWPVPQKSHERENLLLHPYETDAVKAVSSYQQKFGWGSFYMSDKLPSPTPSEDDGASGDADINEEVSCSIIQSASTVENTSILGPPVVSSTAQMDTVGAPDISNPKNISSVSGFQNPMLKSSARRRDPRLRVVNSDAGTKPLSQGISSPGNVSRMEPVDVMNSQKQKTLEELVLDVPALKRQRNELSGTNTTPPPVCITSPVTCPTPLPSNGPVTTPLKCQSEKLPAIYSNATASLNSLLREIAVNPSIWMNILKVESQKSSDDAKSMTHVPNTNVIPGALPSTANRPLTSTLRNTSVGIINNYSQEEFGKVRMKPRDPRRILHANAHTPQASVTVGYDQLKVNDAFALPVMDNLSNLRQEDQSEKNSVSSSGKKPPDIEMQFTSNLRNIADMVSVSQAPMSSPVLLQTPPQQVQSHQAGIETKGVFSDSVSLRKSSDVISDLAIACPYRALNVNAWNDVDHLLEGFDDQQKAAIHRERARRLDEQKKLFSARKLCLVLDLDHTLLNSAKFVEVDPVHDEKLRKKEEQDREKPQRHLFRLPHMGMWTKLRPGIWNFLEKASKLYELHLYTMGNKYYATEMAKLLDPKGELFSGRVLSRGDDGESFDGDDRAPKSKDLDGVLGLESGVVIIDDSIRVWPHNKLNLIVVERYIYFPCSRRQFGLPGPSLLEIDHDERPEDGTLATCLAIIERIHRNFFANESLDEADVRNILASEQRKILAGCRIVFSRMFPVDEANPHMHPIWQTAEQFGAVCTTQIDDQVTHVVANSRGTDKVNWAMETGKFVVHPNWVEASALLYRRANEPEFPVKEG
ncbi:RNA polymerase II C-terminal domain phosphatase-like 3 isoform X2 [Andrographis paniculata]|uniref:RNA polymerase II C-terminal domain phosphatase-like 3 isoform X2 n=1 Tax=Andrographis paniculata TaxID=175694 RepID=UPI0021E6E7B8|nr:RNA polymerase II C-terminal domain phosphatase-like 3 isoform X2 [Andrographis paniculata]